MTATELTYDIPYNPTPLQPKPDQCREPVIADYTIRQVEQVWGPDTECVVERSCSHTYNRPWRIPWVLPIPGEPSMQCLGPQVETVPSGRFDKTAKPLTKGKGWRKLKGAA